MKFKPKETDRNRQEQTGTDRNREEQTGTDRNRQEQTRSDMIRKKQTGRAGIDRYRKLLHHKEIQDPKNLYIR